MVNGTIPFFIADPHHCHSSPIFLRRKRFFDSRQYQAALQEPILTLLEERALRLLFKVKTGLFLQHLRFPISSCLQRCLVVFAGQLIAISHSQQISSEAQILSLKHSFFVPWELGPRKLRGRRDIQKGAQGDEITKKSQLSHLCQTSSDAEGCLVFSPTFLSSFWGIFPLINKLSCTGRMRFSFKTTVSS